MQPQRTGRSKGRGIAVALLGVALAAAACGSVAGEGAGRPLVVATTTIIGDLVRNVAGEAAEVEVLMPPGADPHGFEASARQAALLREADLLVANGLGLEESLEDVLAATEEERGNVLELGPGLDPIPFEAEEDGGSEEGLDPHVWMDPLRMAEGARLLGRRLEGIAPGGWAERAETYAEELEALHAEVEAALSAIPEARRKLVTNHDVLGYWADRYGFEVVGVVIPGGSTLGEPSASGFAEVAETIRREGVAAIFAETTQPSSLARTLAEEVGRPVAVVTLYTESLGEPGSEVTSYVEMMREDAARVAGALG